MLVVLGVFGSDRADGTSSRQVESLSGSRPQICEADASSEQTISGAINTVLVLAGLVGVETAVVVEIAAGLVESVTEGELVCWVSG